MRLAICPYCKIGIAIILDKCKEDLIFNKKGECKCTNCNKIFELYYNGNKLLTRKKEYSNGKCKSDCLC